MAACGYGSTATIADGRWYTVTTTTTCATTATVRYTYTTTTCNWRTVQYEDPPAPPPEYLKLKPVVLYRDCRRAQVGAGRVAAPWARGKLTRWKSLKEKRQAWGLS